MKSQCLTLLPMSLLIAGQVNATSNENDSFRAAVTRTFVQNTIAGTWDSGCAVDENSNASSHSVYEFDAFGGASLTTRHYQDSGCVIPAQAQEFSGTLTLTGTTLNPYGQYVYELQVTAGNGDVRTLLVQLSFDNALTLSIDSSPASFLVTKSSPGVAQ